MAFLWCLWSCQLLHYSWLLPFTSSQRLSASWLAEFARVLVASFRNISIKSSSQAKDERYQTKDFKRTPKRSLFCLMFLNKACVIQNPEENLTPDGRLQIHGILICAVYEVAEELKALIKVIPICSTGVLMSTNVLQHSFIVLQASTMDLSTTFQLYIFSSL